MLYFKNKFLCDFLIPNRRFNKVFFTQIQFQLNWDKRERPSGLFPMSGVYPFQSLNCGLIDA